jgi:hypothetical protein
VQVIGGVIADHIDHGRSGAAGVVQIGQAVTQPRAQVQQGHRGLVGHPAIAIGRARHHAFEQTQDGAHPVLAIDRRDQLHFGRARIGEAHFHPAIGQCFDKGFGPVHARVLPVRANLARR